MRYDYAVIGAGIAGASVAAEIAPHGSVLLLEAEETPGFHSTGRSAAFWSETYGGPDVQPLTTASYEALANPAPEFANAGFLMPRGELHIADAEGADALDLFYDAFADTAVALEVLSATSIQSLVPGIRSIWNQAVMEPTCRDIDVAGLHAAYLKQAKKRDVELLCDSAVTGLERRPAGWTLTCNDQTFEARTIINAAGAWSDDIARLAAIEPIGIKAYRRTMLQLRIDPPAPADMPLVIDALGRFYFKAEAGGKLWLSPHDETPDVPGDVAAEEIDIAVAIDWLEKATDWKVLAVERKWAGLRSFSPDRLPIYGFDPQADDFFWCAGQGGFGIQTAPAAAKLCLSLLLDEETDASIADIDAVLYAPDRFR